MKPTDSPLSSRHGGLLGKLLFFLGIVVVCGAIAWVVLLPSIISTVIHAETGFAVQMEKLSVNPFTASAELRGFVLQNPGGWPAKEFVELRQFTVDAHLFSLLTNRFVADEVVVDVAQVSLVKNQQGALNVDVFRDGLLGRDEAKEQPKGGGRKREFFIKHLVLKFDKLVSADYSGRKPSVKEYNLNIRRDLTDVDSVAKIISPFAGAALGLVTDAVGGLFKGGTDSLNAATGTLKGTASSLQDAGKKTGEMLKVLIPPLDKKKP